MHKRKTLLILGLLSALALTPAPRAAADDVGTLDPQAASPGHLAEAADGSADVAWTSEAGAESAPDHAIFCRVPVGGTCTAPLTLPIPGADAITDGVTGAFPLVGSGSTVYVVGPRYVDDDVIVWTSIDGGASFNAGVVVAGGYSEKTNPSSVVSAGGDEFLISGDNIGLGWSEAPSTGTAGANFDFATGEADVAGSTLALDPAGDPVEAYWTLGSPDRVLFFRYQGSGSIQSPATWAGPTAVAAGYEARLSGGSHGLFLVSQDYAPGEGDPRLLDVRRYDGSNFEAPHTLAVDGALSLFSGGAIAQSPGGRLAVAWPGVRGGDQTDVMRLFASGDGGATYAESDVARVGADYLPGDNAQLVSGDSGQGWLTYRDGAGLHLANLDPLAFPVVAPPASPAPPAPTPSPRPGRYHGVTREITTAVGSSLLTLTVPKSCLLAGQSFYVGVGVRARSRLRHSLHSPLRITQVSFSLDGQKLKALKRRPFRVLVTPPTGAGTSVAVSARVSGVVRRHGRPKTAVRTLRGVVGLCR